MSFLMSVLKLIVQVYLVIFFFFIQRKINNSNNESKIFLKVYSSDGPFFRRACSPEQRYTAREKEIDNYRRVKLIRESNKRNLPFVSDVTGNVCQSA